MSIELSNSYDNIIMEPLDIFQTFDSIGDGKVFIHQVGDVLRALGLNPTELTLNKLLQQFKMHERINYQVFLPMYQHAAKTISEYKPEEFLEAFSNINTNDDGCINGLELRHLLTSKGEKLTENEVDDVLSNVELSQGFIDFKKLIYKVCGSNLE